MTIVLGDNQYGKAEIRLVRVTRSGQTHEIRDLNVSVALSGDFAASHLSGDNSNVVPTDTQKNTVLAFAKEPIGEIEAFALRLGRHFVDDFDPSTARGSRSRSIRGHGSRSTASPTPTRSCAAARRSVLPP